MATDTQQQGLPPTAALPPLGYLDAEDQAAYVAALWESHERLRAALVWQALAHATAATPCYWRWDAYDDARTVLESARAVAHGRKP